MKTIATIRKLDDTRGVVRVEDVYDTDIEDLWEACTDPERLARWIAQVEGDLRPGGIVHATYTSTASGACRIVTCEPPSHLLIASVPESADQREDLDGDSETEVWLSAEGSRTRLVVEERGLPGDKLHFYCAGWQAHLEDLATTLASGEPVHAGGWSPERPADAFDARFQELIPVYEQAGA
ncbi:SRPBCC domain-containing protein [Flexivirga sp.]|uniref:SRPBCC domain-containing protein n=1 Tax=Flexivirga sp. TaxID=1962927 RepID=UPI003F7D3E46